MQIGLGLAALGAALLWLDAQLLAGVGADGLARASWAAPAGFAALFLGLVAAIGDGLRRALRRAIA